MKHKSNHSVFVYPFPLNKTLQIILYIDQDALLMRTYQNCRAPGLVRAGPGNSIGRGDCCQTKNEILAFRRFSCFGCFGCHSSNLAMVRCLVPNCLTLLAKNWDLGLWSQVKDACRSDQIFRIAASKLHLLCFKRVLQSLQQHLATSAWICLQGRVEGWRCPGPRPRFPPKYGRPIWSRLPGSFSAVLLMMVVFSGIWWCNHCNLGG